MPAQTATPETREKAILSLLKDSYESKGYRFIEHPSHEFVPEFLGSYTPDAIALSDPYKVAIEIKAKKSDSTEASLRGIAELFAQHKEWSFVTYYWADFINDLPQVTQSAPDELKASLLKIDHIAELGFIREAFLLYWPILEAIVHSAPFSKPSSVRAPALKPRTVVNSLEELGLLPFSDAAVLRSLISKRNSLVHGDLSEPVSQEEFEVVRRVAHTALGRFESD